MKLSILICTIPNIYRSNSLELIDSITNQALNKPVQVLYLGDNKSMSVGEKRNWLMTIAEGERIIFVDDDDKVSDNYVDRLLEYCVLDVDCVGIGVEYFQNGKNRKVYDYSFKKNINKREKGITIAGRMPNHLCLWKKEVAVRCVFPDANLGEDHRWAELQITKGYSLHLESEILYTYNFDSTNTQTRRRR